jgi:hypothetical protein
MDRFFVDEGDAYASAGGMAVLTLLVGRALGFRESRV